MKIHFKQIAPVALFIAGFGLLLGIYGLVPYFYSNNLTNTFGLIAKISCIQNHGLAILHSYCDNFSYPLGYPFVHGLSFFYIAALLNAFIGNAYLAGMTTSASFLGIGYWGAIQLMKKLGTHTGVACIMGCVYLMLPMVIGHSGYHNLMHGYMLIPAYIFADIVFFQRMSDGRKAYWIIAPYALVKTFALFLDGYTFMISSLASGILLTLFLIQNRHAYRKALLAAIYFLGAYAAAYITYRWYIPGGADYAKMPIDFFRAQGADIISFFFPPRGIMASDWLGIGTNWNAYQFFGDGSNVRHNYLGYSLLAGFIGFLFFTRKKKAVVLTLILSGVIAFLLALGPSLKVHDVRDAEEKSQVTFQDYLMPAEAATLSLHTDFIYQKVPGIKNMRSVYRWLALFQLILIITTALFISYLIRKKHTIFPIILLAAIIVELFPNVVQKHENFTNNYRQFITFQKDIVEPLKAEIKENEKIFFLSSENDFLANYLAATLNAKAYNTGGDKNIALNQPHLPQEIVNMRKYKDINENLYSLMTSDRLDALVIPYFNLRWNAYYWPPSQEYQEEIRQKQLNAFSEDDSRFTIRKNAWFDTVRLNPQLPVSEVEVQ